MGGPAGSAVGGVRLGFQPVDELLEDGFEPGIVVVGVVADDGDGSAVVVGSLAMVAAGFADHAEAVVTVMDIGEAREQVVSCLLGGIEIAGVNHVDHGVGRLGQFVEFVVFLEIVRQGRLARRRRSRLSGMCGKGGGLVTGHAALLVFLAAAAGTGIIPSDFGHPARFLQRTPPVYQAVLADAKFHEQLLAFDRDIAASVRAERCRRCGGALHSGSYARKPRGGPTGLGPEHAERFSFSCAVDGCRKRATPPSLRFLGRHVYLATVVTLISALMLGTTPSRLARLSVVPGLDRRTLARWRDWWRSTFTESPFAAVAMAAMVPPLDIASLPASLLERFAGDIREQLVRLLRFLRPLTGGASCDERAFGTTAMHAF